LLAALALALAGPASAQTPGLVPPPILQGPMASSIRPFDGPPARRDPFLLPRVPRNPFMAPNGVSNLHDDAYQTDTYRWRGPLGRHTRTSSAFYVAPLGSRECASITIDRRGRLVTICVGLDRPTLRFFAKSSGGLLSLSTMAVSVRFETSLGLVAELPVGVVLPNTKWQPTLPMPIIANLLPLLPGQMTPVQFRFTPVGGASWSIDDVYVDPKARG
jgi:hypothetical protein